MAAFWKKAPPPPRETRTLDDAFHLIHAGKIEDGREILRAICRQEPANSVAAVLTALELSRPPLALEERMKLLLQVNRLDPRWTRPETRTLFGYLDVSRGEGENLVRAYNKISEPPPTHKICAVFYLLTRVHLSDVILQTKMLKGRLMTSILVTPSVQGAAQLMLRDDRAPATFQRGIDAPLATVAQYEDYLERALTPDERTDVVQSLALESTIGFGLIQYDHGNDNAARQSFEEAQRQIAGGPTFEALTTVTS